MRLTLLLSAITNISKRYALGATACSVLLPSKIIESRLDQNNKNLHQIMHRSQLLQVQLTFSRMHRSALHACMYGFDDLQPLYVQKSGHLAVIGPTAHFIKLLGCPVLCLTKVPSCPFYASNSPANTRCGEQPFNRPQRTSPQRC